MLEIRRGRKFGKDTHLRCYHVYKRCFTSKALKLFQMIEPIHHVILYLVKVVQGTFEGISFWRPDFL